MVEVLGAKHGGGDWEGNCVWAGDCVGKVGKGESGLIDSPDPKSTRCWASPGVMTIILESHG